MNPPHLLAELAVWMFLNSFVVVLIPADASLWVVLAWTAFTLLTVEGLDRLGFIRTLQHYLESWLKWE